MFIEMNKGHCCHINVTSVLVLSLEVATQWHRGRCRHRSLKRRRRRHRLPVPYDPGKTRKERCRLEDERVRDLVRRGVLSLMSAKRVTPKTCSKPLSVTVTSNTKSGDCHIRWLQKSDQKTWDVSKIGRWRKRCAGTPGDDSGAFVRCWCKSAANRDRIESKE